MSFASQVLKEISLIVLFLKFRNKLLIIFKSFLAITEEPSKDLAMLVFCSQV